jgi:hypothetical protein
MLCCLAISLIVVSSSRGYDGLVSASHDPGECIVCPLAHGASSVCANYSDYDYNEYYYDEPAPSEAAAEKLADTDSEESGDVGDQSAASDWADGYSYSEYDNYEAYYGDFESTDDAAERVPETDDSATATSDNTYESYDEFMDGQEAPQQEVEAAPEVVDESNVAGDAYDSYYEDGWADPWEGDDALYGDYEQSVEEYEFDATNEADAPVADSAADLETGYDEAYDSAMIEVEDEIQAETTPACTDESEAVAPQDEWVDDYEAFYDAYDGLYNYEIEDESAPEQESSSASSSADPQWLEELATRVSQSVSEEMERIQDICLDDSCDEYSSEWDCESVYGDQPELERQSAILSAAQTLDRVALMLQNAASVLRDLAAEEVAEAGMSEGENFQR